MRCRLSGSSSRRGAGVTAAAPRGVRAPARKLQRAGARLHDAVQEADSRTARAWWAARPRVARRVQPYGRRIDPRSSAAEHRVGVGPRARPAALARRRRRPARAARHARDPRCPAPAAAGGDDGARARRDARRARSCRRRRAIRRRRRDAVRRGPRRPRFGLTEMVLASRCSSAPPGWPGAAEARRRGRGAGRDARGSRGGGWRRVPGPSVAAGIRRSHSPEIASAGARRWRRLRAAVAPLRRWSATPRRRRPAAAAAVPAARASG